MGYVLEFRDQPSGNVFSLTPETALEFFRAKGLQPTFSYVDMIREEHDAAFTVAKMMQADLLNTTKQTIDTAIAEGWSMGRFRRELAPQLKAAGWWGQDILRDPVTGELVEAQLGSAYRLNTIYRSNMQSAYSVGRWERIQENAVEMPWLMYDAVDDNRTRPEHERLDNTILPVSDPFWRAFMPPNGYGCRCGVIQLSDNDLERLGLKPSKQPKLDMVKWTNPRTGQVEEIPAAVDPGWDHNPGMDRLDSLRGLAREKVKTYPESWRNPVLTAIEPVREFFNGDSEEMKWHRSAMDDAPEPLKRVADSAERITVLQSEKKGAYAMGGQLIEMNGHKIDTPAGRRVWRHEYGHIIDVQIGGKEGSPWGYYSSSSAYGKAMTADNKQMREVAGKGRKSKKQQRALQDRAEAYDSIQVRAIQATGEEYETLLRTLADEADLDYQEFVDAMRAETLIFDVDGDIQELGAGGRVRLARALVAVKRGDIEEFVRTLLYMDAGYKAKSEAYRRGEVLGSMSDLAGATTKNRVANFRDGYPGHSDQYYRVRPHGPGTEAFANITAMMGHARPIWHEITRRFAPAQVAAWEEIIERYAEVNSNE